jgi:enoyl-CoA hydratase
MSYQAIVYDVRNHIGYVTLNRPQVLNAVNQQMRREIIDVCARMRADSEVRACIFTGAGERAFIIKRSLRWISRRLRRYAVTLSAGA